MNLKNKIYLYKRATESPTYDEEAMKVIVSGKHLDIGESLRGYVTENAEKRILKHFNRAIDAHVTLSKENHLFKTNIIVNEGTGATTVIIGDDYDSDPYISFDRALKNLEKRLKKYKNRLNDRHKKRLHKEIEAMKYIIPPHEDEEMSEEEAAPVIIAENSVKIEMLSVGDAVMKMELLNVPTLVFINAGTKKLNVVYYRNDGNIAWMDTKVEV